MDKYRHHMRIVKIITFCFFALIFMSANAYGDKIRAYKVRSYIPTEGDTIAFYPLNNYYKGNAMKAYSCFYTSECIKKGFKDKFRLNPDNNGFTPSSEISDLYMRVSQVIPSYEYKKDKYFVVNFTRLVDGQQIILAIPHSMKGVPSNAIERSWIHNEHESIICIPFYTKSFLSHFKQIVNEEVVFYGKYNTDTELYDMLEFANKSNEVTHLNCYRGKKYTIINVGFLSTSSGLIYPNLYCTIQDADKKTYYLPITYFVGNAKSDYLMSTKMENLFDGHFKRLIELENAVQNISPESEDGKLISKFSGQDLYYDAILKLCLSSSSKYKYEIRNIVTNEMYPIKTGHYKCLGFQYRIPYIETNRYFELYAVLEDSEGIQFLFPANKFGSSEIDNNFGDFFELKNVHEERERKDKAQADEFKKKEEYYTKKYGWRAAQGIMYDDCSEERYIRLRKKYGAEKAGYMASRQIRIGWTYDEVNEAVNGGYFELLNTYETKYSYYEYYQYRKYNPRYILFENGKVVSIND